jgi:SAM-dependent methyltransferase
MDRTDDLNGTVDFFHKAILEIAKIGTACPARVLDFGCGSGQLVERLLALGYDAYGCDIVLEQATDRCRPIDLEPYRLPFSDGFFDVVVSASVLEHARNPSEYLAEIHRVLKGGGVAMHLLPGKWYLPFEPHILVPFANYFYPNCPTWWFAAWALLGPRHPDHKALSWRETVHAYRDFYDNGVFYLSTREHERLSRSVFGNCEWPMTFYLKHGCGGFARLCRRLPLQKLWGLLSREFRMAFLVQRKHLAS